MSLSVEDLGKKLLGEITECRLDEFLASLRSAYDTTPSTFNVPALDNANACVTNILTLVRNQAQHPIVEITSTSPCSGKTHVLYAAVAAAVLPPPGKHVERDEDETESTLDGNLRQASNDVAQFANEATGKNGAALVLDNDGSFDVARLAQVMKNQLQKSTSRPSSKQSETVAVNGTIGHVEVFLDQDEIEAAVKHALHHVHVFSTQSLPSLIATVESIPGYLASEVDCVGHQSQQRTLELIAIDGMAAFFWQTVHAAESAAFDSAMSENSDLKSNGQSNADMTAQAKQSSAAVRDQYAALVSSLRSLQTQFGCPILATNTALTAIQQTNATQMAPALRLPSYRPLLPAVWTKFCTLRIVVQREEVRKFAPGMGIQRALVDREVRGKVLEEGKFEGFVDGAMFANGARHERCNDLASLKFTFQITSKGIDFD